jgi:PH (Pleckstrin Homology) domain-containing protein
VGSEFPARLSARVLATSILGTVVLLTEAALMFGLSLWAPWPASVVCLAVGGFLVALFIAIALVAIRGYRVEPGVLRVDRPLWASSHSLVGLQSAARDPDALRFTWLGFGNNGFFALNSWRRVEPYGWCRVLATDPASAVVLRTAGATYIVTPDRPDEFIARALALSPRA